MSVVHQSQNATSVVEKLAAIVPLYNEQATVTQLLTQLIAQEVISQVVIVDDGSTDNSVPLVKEWIDTLQPAVAERIQLVQHDINKGKGRAIRTGLEHVTCSHVIIQDADLEYDPADIKKLWAVMQSGEADVVYGSRYLENPKLQKGRWVMQSGVRFLNLLVRVLYGVKLTDEATCYKMFRTFDLRAMRLKCEGFEFCAEVSHFVARTDLQLTEVAISYRPRSVADGKKLRLRDGFHSLLIVLFGQVRFRPRYFLALALFLGGVCLVPYLTTSERGAADAKNAEVTKAVTKADAVTFDVGRIPAGTVVRHSFPISDATGAAYAPDAVRVNKSCGCTSAQVRTFADSRLYLDMLVNTDQKYGQFRERVSVELPGRSPGEVIEYSIKGTVFPAISAAPQHIVINEKRGESTTTEIALQSELDLNWSELQVVVPWPDQVSWSLDETDDAAPKIVLTHMGSDSAFSRIRRGTVDIMVPDAQVNERQYSCSVHARIEPNQEIEVLPRRIVAQSSPDESVIGFSFFLKGANVGGITEQAVSISPVEPAAGKFSVVAVNHLNSQLVKVEGQVANCTAGIQKLVIHADSSQLGVEFNLPNAF